MVFHPHHPASNRTRFGEDDRAVSRPIPRPRPESLFLRPSPPPKTCARSCAFLRFRPDPPQQKTLLRQEGFQKRGGRDSNSQPPVRQSGGQDQNFDGNLPLDAPNGDCAGVSSADRAPNRALSPARVTLHQLIDTLDDRTVQAFFELFRI